MIAYARGRGRSLGTPLPYQHDGDDVRAVINWIAKQPWSDGQVGMYGSAYSGFTGWAATKHLPPALKAIAMTSPTAPGIDVPDDGGVFRNSAYRWSLYVSNAIDEKTYNDDAAGGRSIRAGTRAASRIAISAACTARPIRSSCDG